MNCRGFKLTHLAALVVVAWGGHAADASTPGGWLPWPSDTAAGVNAIVLAETSWDPDGPSGPQSPWLVVAGYVTDAGGIPVNRVAAFDGVQWHALGTGMNNRVHALCVHNGDLVAGGFFTAVGQDPANFIARWNGESWVKYPNGGPEGPVLSLAVYQGQLYAGGLSGNSNKVKRWTGTFWLSLGAGLSTGPNDAAYAMCVHNNELIVGGLFSTAGGQPANRIASWSNLSWHTLGTGMSGGNLGAVQAVVSHNGVLYAGGSFLSAGGQPGTAYLAQWDGANWSSVGGGVSNGVYCLTGYQGSLVAGGTFTTAGSVPVSNIASWNGSSWTALGSGLEGNPFGFSYALHSWNGELAVGGEFVVAGGQTSRRVARWSASGVPWIVHQPEPLKLAAGEDAAFHVTPASGYEFGGSLSYQWRRNMVPLADDTDISGSGTADLSISNVQFIDAGDYDCVVSNAFGSVTSLQAALTVPPPECPADANGDGQVNGADLSVLLSGFGSSCP